MLLRRWRGFKLSAGVKVIGRPACKPSIGVLDIECIQICFLNGRITGDICGVR